jgi:hypothetical protein
MRRASDIELSSGISGRSFATAWLRRVCSAAVLLAGLLIAPCAGAGISTVPGKAYADFSLYFLGAAMSGDITVGNATADLNVGFDEILDHLEFGAMGFGRVGRDRWSFTAEVLYMGLGASKDLVNSNFDQWVVESRLAYRLSPRLEPFAGVRYNNLSGEIRGAFGRNPSETRDWVDPILGATATVPLGRSLALEGRGDIGGFGIGSDLTWQFYPYLDWTLMPTASLQAGYRLLDVDYETGSGGDAFGWDVLTQGPQVGVTVRFEI